MKLAVIGTGYVGLVAGTCFADTGNEVVCVDKDAAKVEALHRGEIPIFEPGLETIVKRCVQQGRLTFTTDTRSAVEGSDIIFLAVGTPSLPSGDPDLQYVRAAAGEIGQAMNRPKIIVNKSTVPIGAHKQVAEWVSAHTKHAFEVVSNPEFLKEGTAVEDFLKPDRVVIGTASREVFETMAELYAPFVRQGNPIVHMDPVSAEITKYACNSFLAARISFMNEMAALCDAVGGDVELVRRGMAGDVRIGKHFLYAGAGYGGSCFPKDVRALISTGVARGLDLGVIRSAHETNEIQKHVLGKKLMAKLGTNLKGKVIGMWGLSFKPNTDDMREAPSLTICEDLIRAGAVIQAFDPVAMEVAAKTFRSMGLSDSIRLATSASEAATGADALLLVTEWNEFRHPDFAVVRKLMRGNLLIDGRNLYDPAQMRKVGFDYVAVGRAAIT